MNDLTIQLVIIGAIIVALAAFMLWPQIKELLGENGENEKKFVCPRCGKKSQVGTYSRETHELVCVDCANKEKEEIN